MKQKLFILSFFFCQILQAQQNVTAPKTKNHCISFYVGFSLLDSYYNNNRYTAPNAWGTINPYRVPSFLAVSNLFSLTYKYKKHEIIPLMYLASYYNNDNNGKRKPFLLGGSLSYLYHFNQKPTHLFFEANLQTFFYNADNGDIYITPYGSSQHQVTLYSGYNNVANIQTYIVNPALGLEVKLWKLTYLQLAVGSGTYYTKGKSETPAGIITSYGYGFPDTFRNIYPGVFGLNWYARLSIIVRAFNF